MRSIVLGVFTVGAALAAVDKRGEPDAAGAASRAAAWLVRVQGPNGGWGQDGGEFSHVRTGERLESQSNDVANTAVAVMALLRAGHTPASGQYSDAVRRGTEFMLRHIEASPVEGLAVTPVRDTQIQRKLGPYIDSFLSSMALAELDGQMGDPTLNRRVHAALEKVVNKIQRNQQSDGSWNISGGWAPVLGTSIASRGLYAAQSKGVQLEPKVMARLDQYSKASARPEAAAAPAAAGVRLYQSAQALEQLSRSADARASNAKEIREITGQLSDVRFVNGFGSMGGEEFFSYLNISDSLRRNGGKDWNKWNTNIKTRLISLQNGDGTWAGHHCITGRVAVTSAAVLTLLADRAPQAQQTAIRR